MGKRAGIVSCESDRFEINQLYFSYDTALVADSDKK